MNENLEISQKIRQIIENLKSHPVEISFAIINLKTCEPEIAGYNMDTFIYPASIYKIFIGAEILRKVYQKELNLTDIVEITSPMMLIKTFDYFLKAQEQTIAHF